jgi:hypothetical protein
VDQPAVSADTWSRQCPVVQRVPVAATAGQIQCRQLFTPWVSRLVYTTKSTSQSMTNLPRHGILLNILPHQVSKSSVSKKPAVLVQAQAHRAF